MTTEEKIIQAVKGMIADSDTKINELHQSDVQQNLTLEIKELDRKLVLQEVLSEIYKVL